LIAAAGISVRELLREGEALCRDLHLDDPDRRMRSCSMR
jgi:hypothetical protein